MKLIAIMPARNEDWVLGLTARAVLMWCDKLIVYNHASTDGTERIIADLHGEFPGRVGDIADLDVCWREMAHRQALLSAARDEGATHIAYIDADEILSGGLLPSIRQHIERLPVGHMLSLPWLQLRGSIDQVMCSGMWASQIASAAFRDEPNLHWAARNGYDFHQRQPMGRAWTQLEPLGRHRRGEGLMHLQFLSERRLRAKQALYKMQEVIRWPGRTPVAQIDEMYSRTVRESSSAHTMRVAEEWWKPYHHLLDHLHINAEPWQEAECRWQWDEYGPEKFAGLDLFGVV